ncbi:hypothetical protein A3H22_03280 [Candidatus Peribacteria bacterium RIFCSPLOWO2_12_FULL_55_15]|nr:MAG: hypothetical protein A2789_01725 [Candidatus Peribacteria bacterium RIFCSPHIGHO2_01_FULL_54_22]OGJ63752.1 MAG: hypothetical protein A3D12_01675 [Candidatus Peribacteria bacterium RIFCSPHIGHO2_02_FULL_55_24]OGJ65258.1 MAG: hypothetical protein A3E47_00580 [Candidatus Peribacteria bacterium RIFCSPHIGHO2_12_FULL_54_10]OGJ69014.1 MAG: hypothetical protein A2947_01750 [Candidatus Peribacteria bacterium RIFCSPLOWO2_01_FULL_54_110]OGJ70258.1 MAG: hypothetical protein A3H22_03280 [Candidatus Pe
MKGMYGTEFLHASHLFGLSCGQMRSGPNKVTHNSGWYNRHGEKLGWGDLSSDDYLRISRELQYGEHFVILGEQDSFQNFVGRTWITWSMADTKPDEESPGIDYVAERTICVITFGNVYVVDQCELYKEATTIIRDGLTAYVLKKDAVRQLLA